ncbi:SHOCT domain-containing protein [Natronococcus sp. A-GB1]|uniref:SHOCT domain-containing protein n=1 Tax=Natronococcus sp. A-GB1 TaxID=3037648 RepID=UPI00241F5B06|nr:SHOCT domain-containing protein [Natronococcus sp. A-GB1]MDG5761511.1 SHOCT domain-containing protein [Natronococcus sp. A-GB1]
MTFDAREFVAEDCWILIGVVTFALLSLAGLAGLEALADVIAIVGWFLLVPLFLFWGEEIADIALGDDSEPDRGVDGAFEDVFSEAETASKPSETETSARRERELDENR